MKGIASSPQCLFIAVQEKGKSTHVKVSIDIEIIHYWSLAQLYLCPLHRPEAYFGVVLPYKSDQGNSKIHEVKTS